MAMMTTSKTPAERNIACTPSAEISAPAATKAATNAPEVHVLCSANRRPCSASGSSLATSKQLPVNMIKIDKSFVLEMATEHSDAAIVRSTNELAHNLGLQVIAEAVEDRQIWEELARLGCDFAQGYYLSRPLPADKLAPKLGMAPADEGHPERPPLRLVAGI